MEKPKVKLLKVGYCKHCERIARKKGNFKNVKFPMIVGLIEDDEKGNILFDTGYSEHFHECTSKFPDKLYALTTPVTLPENEKIENILKKENLTTDDINYVVISHFHADHISGLRSFNKAKFVCSKLEYEQFKSLSGIKAVKKGFLKGLIPDNFEERTTFVENLDKINLEKEKLPFKTGYYFSKDLSIVGLEGHSLGQIGMFVKNDYFFIADACWFEETYKNLDLPSKITSFVFDNMKNYKKNVLKINELYKYNKNIKIIPSHCNKTYEREKNNE